MTFVSRLAVAAAFAVAAPLAVTSVPAFAQALAPAVGKPLQAATKAAAAGNTGAALAQINTARAAAKTPAERQKVAEAAAYVYTRAGQFAKAAQELESIGAGPKQLAPLYYRAGQYDKAIATARKAGGADMQTIIAQSYIKQGKHAEAAKTYQALIKANGPKEQYLENLAGAQFRMGDKKAYLSTIQQLIKVDPSPARWKALLIDMKQTQMQREAKLALFQLMRQTGNLTRADDYQEFAKLAIVNNQSGVAKAALDEAVKANAIASNDAMTQKLLQAATKRAAADTANAAKLAAAPKTALQGGSAYLGSGQYPQAIAAFQRAVQADPKNDHAKLQLGIAQVRAGQAAAARKTFESVPEGSGMKDVAALWALYAGTRA